MALRFLNRKFSSLEFKDDPGYSATLSTISTGLNAGATIMFKTIIPGKVSEEKMIPYMRTFIVLFGAFITGGALTFQFVSGTIIGFSMMVLG